MIKRTLYFSNPAYLSLKLGQLVIRLPETSQAHGHDMSNQESHNDGEGTTSAECMKKPAKTVPIEDIGMIILDHRQITLTQGLMETLIDNNCAIVTCGSNHLPVGLMLPLY